MNRFVLVIRHEMDKALVEKYGTYMAVNGQIRAVYVPYYGETSDKWVSEEIAFLPKAFVITLPDGRIDNFFMVVGIENKYNEQPLYISESITFKKDKIQDRFK